MSKHQGLCRLASWHTSSLRLGAPCIPRTVRCLSSTSRAAARPSGPLPSDPLAPPPKPTPAPQPPLEHRTTSAILEDDYNTKSRWKHDPNASMAKLSPYAFMLKLKAALVDDEGSLALFPDEVQHGKFVPAKSGMSMYCALHPKAIRSLLNKKGPHVWNKINIDPSAIIPSTLPAMVEDMLGKRVVQELDVARRIISAIPKAHAGSPFLRPLTKEQAAALRQDLLPTYDDATVIAVLDTGLRDHLPATLLAINPQTDADVPVFPLKLAAHAPEAVAHVRSIVALERRRAVTDSVLAAEEDTKERVAARAAAEGVSKYEAGTEMVAESDFLLPQAEIDASVDGLEAHRADEEARFVAVVVPRDVPEQWRTVGVPLVVALLRVALYHGNGWMEELQPASE